MNFIPYKKWIIVAHLMITVYIGNAQLGMPMQMPMPMPMPMQMPMPMPMPMFGIAPPPPMHVAILPPIAIKKTTRATTTTTERSFVAIPIPVPVPVQVAVPAMPMPVRPKAPNYPPCPPCVCVPSCTPSFYSYCSPCHKKCRCPDKSQAPVPMRPMPPPVPLPGPAFGVPMPPPQLMIVGVPPLPPRKVEEYSSETSDSDYSISSDSSCDSNNRRRKFRRSQNNAYFKSSYRRRGSRYSDGEFIKPVLGFLSKNGRAKYSRPIKRHEAERLLGQDNHVKLKGSRRKHDVEQTFDEYYPIKYKRPIARNVVRRLTDEGNHIKYNRPIKRHEVEQILRGDDRVKFTSTNRPPSHEADQSVSENDGHVRVLTNTDVGRSQVKVISSGSGKHNLAKGEKHLVFNPPPGKQITNLSLTFDVV